MRCSLEDDIPEADIEPEGAASIFGVAPEKGGLLFPLDLFLGGVTGGTKKKSPSSSSSGDRRLLGRRRIGDGDGDVGDGDVFHSVSETKLPYGVSTCWTLT